MIGNDISNMVVGSFSTNCWCYPYDFETSDSEEWEKYQGKLCVLIDPGYEAENIITWLEKQKRYPRYILLTHGHFDHIGAINGIVSYYQTVYQLNLGIGIHKNDKMYLGKESYNVHKESFAVVMGNPGYIDEYWSALPEPTLLFSDGDSVGSFKVIHLPGHSLGSVAFYDENAGVIFSGDTLFKNGIGRTDLPGGDRKAIMASLKRLFSMDKNIVVYPGHGPITYIGAEYM